MHSLDDARRFGERGHATLRRRPVSAQVTGDDGDPPSCSAPQDRVAALLNQRVSGSPTCPRCGSARVQRWGKIAGIQRLRCRACARTFNPLTGTPLARLRRRDLWLGHALVLEAGLSLRRGARAIGVHYNTALRWRHRWLERPRERMARRFTGPIAAEILTFEPCAQQPRGWTRVALPEEEDPVVPDAEQGVPERAVPVLLLGDQRGARADAVLSVATVAGLAPILDRLVDPATNSLCSDGHAAARAYCRSRGIAHRWGAPSRNERHGLVACRRRLRAWMRRFAGVSAHRLANYLGWRRLLDDPGRHPAPFRWLDRALDAGQQPTVTEADTAGWARDGRRVVLPGDPRVSAADVVAMPRSLTQRSGGCGDEAATCGGTRACRSQSGGERGDRLTGARRPA
jgi:transposase-like protein